MATRLSGRLTRRTSVLSGGQGRAREKTGRDHEHTKKHEEEKTRYSSWFFSWLRAFVVAFMTLRIAVVGVGHLGKHHARILSSLPGAELVAVVDTNRPRAEEIAATNNT